MEVNPKISSKTFLILFIFSLVLFFIFGGYAINCIIKTKNYIKIDATIVETGYNYSADSDHTTNYIKYTYTYNDNNYSNVQRTFFRINHKEGNIVTIFIDPMEPNVVRDEYMLKISSIIGIVTIIFSIFCVKAYLVKRKQDKMG